MQASPFLRVLPIGNSLPSSTLVHTRPVRFVAAMFSKRPRVLVVSDLDNTMVAHNDPSHSALKEFNELWRQQFSDDSLLVFSTGRSLEKYQQLREAVPDLQHPDLLVCSVGTEIYRFDGAKGTSKTPHLDQNWLEHLSQGWDRDTCMSIAAQFPELALQQESEQRPHKVSFNTDAGADIGREVTQALQRSLAHEGIDAQVVYSGGRDVDILPARAGKGKALAFLLRLMEEGVGAPTQGTLVCGDSGNDADLFQVAGVHGVAVSNSHQELREFIEGSIRGGNGRVMLASRECAGGIVEALHKFGFA